MHLDLTDAEALAQELGGTIDDARYPFSPRVTILREVLGQLRPETVREPLPPAEGL
jgi:hypothetical protein